METCTRRIFDRRKMHSLHLLSCTWFSFWSFVFCCRLSPPNSHCFVGYDFLFRVSFVCEIFFLISRVRGRERNNNRPNTEWRLMAMMVWSERRAHTHTLYFERQPAQKIYNFYFCNTQYFGFTCSFLSFFFLSHFILSAIVEKCNILCICTEIVDMHAHSPPLSLYRSVHMSKVWKCALMMGMAIRVPQPPTKEYSIFSFHFLLLLFRNKCPDGIYSIYFFKY